MSESDPALRALIRPTFANRQPPTANRQPPTANRPPPTANRPGQAAARRPNQPGRQPERRSSITAIVTFSMFQAMPLTKAAS